jgi:hypothetical protein
MLKTVDLNAKHNRAVFVYTGVQSEILFGLAIRRHIVRQRYRWCFYLGITEEEYLSLVLKTDVPNISFLGVASDCISVPQIVAAGLLSDPPPRFVGCHYEHDPLKSDWSSESITTCLEHFIEEMLPLIRGNQDARKH